MVGSTHENGEPRASAPLDRFRLGFAAEVAIDRRLIARPGTSVLARDDRLGSGAVACYWIHRRAVLWADPAVVDRLTALHGDRTIDPETLAEALTAAGFEHVADVEMRVLTGSTVTAGSSPGWGYDHHRLRSDDPDDMASIRRFVERSDPQDVEDAALDDLDNFDEAAINVVTGAAEPSEIVAYASASAWPWDPSFGDIGVLVAQAHRGRGLGRFVAANTAAGLLAHGRLPLYRHERTNHGSRRIAISMGFEPAATLAYYRVPSP